MQFYTNVQRIGMKIFCRGYDKDSNTPVQFEEEYHPIIFTQPHQNSSKKMEYHSLDGIPLEPSRPGNLKQTTDFIELMKSNNLPFYGMEDPIYNFISDKFAGKMEYDFQKIRKGLIDIETEAENGFPDPWKATEPILIVNIYSGGKYHIFSLDKYGVFDETEIPDYIDLGKDSVVSYVFSNELDLMKAVIVFLSKEQLDILSGWHSEGFDIPYLINRAKVLGLSSFIEKISPFGKIVEKTIKGTFGKDKKVYEIYGINHIDYLLAYQKFSGKKLDSYKLDNVGFVELKINKVNYTGSFQDLYRKNWQKFCWYNMRDVEILVRLEEKLKILLLITSLAYDAKVNYLDTFKQTRMWDSIFYNFLLEKNIVIPSRPPHVSFSKGIEGAWVKDVRPGMYDWIMSFDLNSLYPSLIMQYNISPETLVSRKYLMKLLSEGKDAARVLLNDMIDEHYIKIPKIQGNEFYPKHIIDAVKDLNLTICANGTLYRKDIQGFIPELMEKFYDERRMFKNKMLEYKKKAEEGKGVLSEQEINDLKNQANVYNIFQNVRKISLNSAYGSLAQKGFRFFKNELASAITMSGQFSIMWANDHFNKYLTPITKKNEDYVLAVDTDSAHIHLSDIVDLLKSKKPDMTTEEIVDKLDKFAETNIIPEIDKFYKRLQEYVNAPKQKMEMKRESIVQTGVYTKKKKYAYWIHDLEGVRFKSPILKITGIESVKSSTAEFSRKKIEKSIELLLKKQYSELRDFVSQTKKEWMGRDIEEIAIPTGMNGIDDYDDGDGEYKKGTPIHVRASLMYNHFLEKQNLSKKYPTIEEGDKIKYFYLKMPNPVFENVIAFPLFIPKELRDFIEPFVDKEVMYNKSFYEPLKRIADAAGIELSSKPNLGDLF